MKCRLETPKMLGAPARPQSNQNVPEETTSMAIAATGAIATAPRCPPVFLSLRWRPQSIGGLTSVFHGYVIALEVAASPMRRIIDPAVLNDTSRMRHRWCGRIGLVPPSVRYIACSHL
jgi:hypothetical protein